MRTDGERKLYMHSLASTTEIAVPLRVLDNATMWEANVEASPRSFVVSTNQVYQFDFHFTYYTI